MAWCDCCMGCYTTDECDSYCGKTQKCNSNNKTCAFIRVNEIEEKVIDRELVINGLYRHFKGTYYFVRGIAKHTEDNKDLVLYSKHVNGVLHDLVYARPFNMFMSEVDRSKYPNAEQKYRFELVVKLK